MCQICRLAQDGWHHVCFFSPSHTPKGIQRTGRQGSTCLPRRSTLLCPLCSLVIVRDMVTQWPCYDTFDSHFTIDINLILVWEVFSIDNTNENIGNQILFLYVYDRNFSRHHYLEVGLRLLSCDLVLLRPDSGSRRWHSNMRDSV